MSLPDPSGNFSVKNILKIAIPVMASQAIPIIYCFLDSTLLGKLGTSALAISYIASTAWTPITEFLDGLRVGTSIFTTRFIGGNKSEDVSKTLNIGLFAAFLIGGLVLISAGFISKISFSMSGASAFKEVGSQYLYIYLLSAPFAIIQFVTVGFFTGLKDTVTPFFLTGVTYFFSIFLEYIFLYGKFGCPKLGLMGAVFSTLIAYVIGALLSIVFLIRSKSTKRYLNLRIPFKSLRYEFAKTSFSLGSYTAILSGVWIVFAFIFTAAGQSTLAAQQITFNVYAFSYYPLTGFMTATSIIVANLVGAKRGDLIYRVIFKIIGLAFFPFLIVNLIMFFNSFSIATFFSPLDGEVANFAAASIKVVAVNNILGSIYVALRGAMVGLNESRMLLISAIIGSCFIFLPLSYILGIKMGLGSFGGFLAFLIWTIFDCLFFAWRLFINRGWKRNVES